MPTPGMTPAAPLTDGAKKGMFDEQKKNWQECLVQCNKELSDLMTKPFTGTPDQFGERDDRITHLKKMKAKLEHDIAREWNG